MVTDLDELKIMEETNRYLRRLMQSGIGALSIAFLLDIGAAIYSHIALWQVLMWLCITCVVLSALFFLSYSWVARNNL